MADEKPALQGLRALMARHDLTQRDVAVLACVSVKTVESWLASPDSANWRNFHPRHLAGIHYNLSAFLRSRRAGAKKKGGSV